MEGSWAAAGVECMCIRSTPWVGGQWPFLVPIDGPKFMQQYTIKAIEYRSWEDEGHRVKLKFPEYGEKWFCICGFEPIQKLQAEDDMFDTAPVSKEEVHEMEKMSTFDKLIDAIERKWRQPYG